MRVFVTGASGFVGSAVVRDLLTAGHQVLGLARSDESAKVVKALGADVHRGSLDDTESLKSGARQCDAVIHTAMNHDFSKFAENCAEEKRAIAALGEALVDLNKTLIVTSGLGFLAQGRPGTELDDPNPGTAPYPRDAEGAALPFAKQGVKVMVVRLPQVHNEHKAGLISFLVFSALQKGYVAYVGEGNHRWAAVHIDDASQVYRLALERGESGKKYHAVAEEGVTGKAIAETVAQRMNLPVKSIPMSEAPAYFGPLAGLAAIDIAATSEITQKELNWHPHGKPLLTDLANMVVPTPSR